MVRRKITLWGLAIMAAVIAAPDRGWAGNVRETYRLYCVQCHGTEANGWGINNTAGGLAVSPRDHTNSTEMSKLSNQDIRLVIAKGGDAVSKSELMPPWGEVLTEKAIDELVLYLRQLCGCEGKK